MENGDIKDSVVFHLVEQFLIKNQQSQTVDTLRKEAINKGREIAAFLRGTNADIGRRRQQFWSPRHGQSKRRVLLMSSQMEMSLASTPENFTVVSDVDEEEFLIAQLMQCKWREYQEAPIPTQKAIGFILPNANPPRAVV